MTHKNILLVDDEEAIRKMSVMSGGGPADASRHLSLAGKLGSIRIFEKPFDTAAFRRTVYEMLN